MNIEPTTPIEKAAYLLMQHPIALMELLGDCVEAEIIGINQNSGMPYWYHTGEDLIEK